MGKRSSFARVPSDVYDTPPEPVAALLPHLPPACRFMEPCGGKGALIASLQAAGHRCTWAGDIEPRADGIEQWDALKDRIGPRLSGADMVITNPPWKREILHPLILRFSNIRPTWLLIDSDWMHTVQAAAFMPRLRKIVSIGRVKWIPGSTMTGKDNAVWALFTQPMPLATEFVGRAA